MVVRAAYPGANPAVIGQTVAAPLEQAINGVEGMIYQSSQSASDGAMTLTVTFALGTDLDKAQVQVQNRVAQALPKLPQEVQRIGVTTNKASPDLTLVVHLISPNNRYDMLYLSQLRPAERQRPRWRASTAWATCRSSARAPTPCACGWIPEKLAAR